MREALKNAVQSAILFECVSAGSAQPIWVGKKHPI